MSSPRPNTTPRLFRGYGPLVGFTAILAATALLVPTTSEVSTTGFGPNSGIEATDGVSVAGDTTTPTGAAVAGGGAGGTTAATGANQNNSGVGDTSQGAAPPSAERCPDREQQVPNDPYSPPCVVWAGGNNGGETSRGVDGDSIRINVRTVAFDNGYLDELSRQIGAALPRETPADIERTLAGLVEYFNTQYQFYGRKLELVLERGRGDLLLELQGGGQEAAEADALHAGQEVRAFADISAVSAPYADALARQGVISFGAPYMSREWLTERRPYVWSPLTDCSTVVEAVASYYAIKAGGRPATYAQGDLAGRPRTLAIVGPDNSWYQQCMASGRAIVDRAGHQIVMDDRYTISVDQASSQAASLVAKMKDAQATTVLCGCDPIILLFVLRKAVEQNYFPEWIVSGVAFQDMDIVGTLFPQNQWENSFGVSFSGPTVATHEGPGYQAYKVVRNDEPSIAVEVMYWQLQMLAIGVQMAGPTLTPETFEAGMFRYIPRIGPAGLWAFGPGDYTTSNDAREIYWDPNASSAAHPERGAYIDPNAGARYPIGQWPANEPVAAPR